LRDIHLRNGSNNRVVFNSYACSLPDHVAASEPMFPPDEAKGLEVVKKIQSLNGPDLEKRVRAEVGDPMLAFFSLLAKSTAAPGDDDHAIAKKVHLMVLAYLIRGELHQPAGPAPAKPKSPAPKKK
jgi:hypothetical protein